MLELWTRERERERERVLKTALQHLFFPPPTVLAVRSIGNASCQHVFSSLSCFSFQLEIHVVLAVSHPTALDHYMCSVYLNSGKTGHFVTFGLSTGKFVLIISSCLCVCVCPYINAGKRSRSCMGRWTNVNYLFNRIPFPIYIKLKIFGN